jgi:predicted phage terminase large subunit-like protein
MTNKEIFEAIKKRLSKKASKRLIDFIIYTKMDYQSGWFNELLCEELDQFLQDVEDGKNPRLMIMSPPRAGKSEIGSRRFPAFALGKHPDWHVISCSYSASLAERMSRDTQRIIDDPLYSDVFPNTRISGKNSKGASAGGIRTAELWETVSESGELHGGSYRAAGVGGGITGQGMHIGIIDDPAKDYKTASSKAYQESVIDWYDTTFFTRRDPKINGIIIILTRWHKNDLAGQLLARAEKGGEAWRVVSFPMEWEDENPEIHRINGKKYKLRQKGELLFPERMPRDFVEACKLSGSLTWNALYQQRPTERGGGLIKSDWFGEYDQIPNLKWTCVIGDTAQKTAERNDFSVFEHWGLGFDGNLYLLDMIRGKWEADELKRRAVAFWKKCASLSGSKCRYMGIEDKSSGTGLIQQIKNYDGASIPIKAIQRSRDKLSRFMDVQGYIQSGYIKIPNDRDWVNDFLAECESITSDFKTHDDQVDPMIDAIELMLGNHTVNYARLL